MHFHGLRSAQAPAASILSAQEDERYPMITGRSWRNLLIHKYISEPPGLFLRYRRCMPSARYRGPPMTLANMRAQGVRSLWVVCEL